MKILFATSEIAPWVKTGGLGDIASALPAALMQAAAAAGTEIEVRILVPAYPALWSAFPNAQEIARPHWLGGVFPTCSLREAKLENGFGLWMLDHAPYYDRAGNPYVDATGKDWPDNDVRFGLLSRVAAWIASEASTLDWKPDVLHCNDWQTALAPAYLRYLTASNTATVLTIHNLAFQGIFKQTSLYPMAFPETAWQLDGVEFYGLLSCLKSGILMANRVTTVSPTYAQEIQTVAEGMGLDALLRHRSADVTGILNGIDESEWDPRSDPHLKAPYAHFSVTHSKGKAKCKLAMQQEMGLKEDDSVPLLAVVSRLTYQKGLDLLAEIANDFAKIPAQLVLLGSGESALEQAFQHLSVTFPQHIAVRIGFDEALAHRIEAAADVFIMPSRFEPCGLNQMYSQRYGTLPIVRATGGLADTVEDEVNGFSFSEPTAEALMATIERAIAIYQQPKAWRKIQLNAMRRDFSWAKPAAAYLEMYQQLIEERQSSQAV